LGDGRTVGKVRIHTSKQVLVEGREEVMVLESLTEHLELTDIQAHDYGGKNNIRRFLSAYTKLSEFPRIRSLAIIADADFNSGATNRILDALRSTSLPQPPNPLIEATQGHLSVWYLVLPHGKQEGMLEDICLESVRDDPIMDCVQDFVDCVGRKKPGWPRRNIASKARVHMYLATQDPPDRRLGEASKAGVWPLDDVAFEPLKTLLQQM
jgi:hypothetical protein